MDIFSRPHQGKAMLITSRELEGLLTKYKLK